MSRYEDLCRLFFQEQRRQSAEDNILRELPIKMRQAISDYLAAPTGDEITPTLRFAQRSLVDLYRPLIDQNGERSWEPCGTDQCLWQDPDGMHTFCIGICIETPGAPAGVIWASIPMMHFAFCVEKCDTESVELRIKNLSGSIPIANVHEPADYADAAKRAIDLVMDYLRNPTATSGSRPIGFINPATQ